MKLIVFLIGLFVAYSAQGCRCIPLTFEEEVKNSKYIFHGIVTSFSNYEHDIEIIQIWKGDFKSKVFHLKQGTTSCESRIFELNKEYLFYLSIAQFLIVVGQWSSI